MTETDQLPEEPAKLLERALFEIKRVIVGQELMVERMMVGLLARGHCLLEGVPGIAKTLAAETLATVAGGTFSRIQFTPDLVPSDIIGTRIYRPSTERFDTELGPVIVNFVLADEINRAPAKVQSALLEVMAEKHVSIGGRSYPVPEPFLVLATQNPIESEGVYQLPEAQRDRFLLKIDLDHPSGSEELAILYRMSVDPPTAEQILEPKQVIACSRPPTGCSSTTPSPSTRCGWCWPPATRRRSGCRSWPSRWPSAPARAPRWAWWPPAARWRCCAAASTWCRRTSTTWRGR